MKKCYECGKELKFWEGYSHPNLGKKALVCSKCYDELKRSMDSYCNFILKNSNKKMDKLI